MVKILKYPLTPMMGNFVLMHSAAKILSVQVQKGAIFLWALCEDSNPTVNREIGVYATGQALINPGQFISTVQLIDQGLVFHVFDKGAS